MITAILASCSSIKKNNFFHYPPINRHYESLLQAKSKSTPWQMSLSNELISKT